MAVSTVKVTINGQTYNLTKASSGAYEATITAPATSSYPLSGHYYPVQLAATDTAGNTLDVNDKDATWGKSLQLVVKEKVVPVITIVTPTQGMQTADATPLVEFTITDNDSGIARDSVVLKIDGTAVSSASLNMTPINDGYKITHTPTTDLTDGTHTVAVTAADNDGNVASPKSATFEVLAYAPELSITSPTANQVTNKTTLSMAGTTTAETVTATLNGNAISMLLKDGRITASLTLTEGKNTLIVIAKSKTGVESSISRFVYRDTVKPSIGKITLTPNPADAGKTFVISVTVTDTGGV
jgi:hypothetical protein